MLIAAKRYGWIALIAVAGAWLLYVMLGSASFQICLSKNEDNQPEQSTKENSPEILRALVVSARVRTDCMFVFLYDSRDAITAISTALLTVITGFLVLVARRQYTTTRTQLRAYVMVEAARILDFGPKPKAEVTFKNSGQTPAYNFTIWTSVEVASDPLDRKPVRPDGQADTKGSLAAGTTVHTLDSPSRIIIAEEIAGIQNGKAGFFVFGQAQYDDVFGKTHTTDFCFIYGGRDGCHPNGVMAQYKDWTKAT